MKFTVIALAAAALASSVAASASAAPRVTDLDFMKAQRCRGLADGLGIDASAFDTFVKAEGRTRSNMVVDRADGEYDRARRDARSPSRRETLTAELNNACQAYGAQPYAKQGKAAQTPS